MTVYHCTFRGRVGLNEASDIFSHSLGIESSANNATVGASLRDAWKALWQAGSNGLDQHYNDRTIYEEVTVAQVIDPMVPDLGAAHHTPFAPELPGLGLAETLPQQSAIAVSLIAGLRPNGTPFRGRFYLPAPQATVLVADGLLDPAVQQNILDLVMVFISTLRSAGHIPSVWSRTVEDLVAPVSQVKVGSKIDTIRSRRNDRPEVYKAQTVAD
jgi:hypothetical protein